jgi:phenylacetate-coenzyme A ligase PaaK-like adenylate-forming protein
MDKRRAGWWSSRSSGSTGEPFRVFYDARAWALLKYLVKLRARRACGVEPHHRLAVLDAIPPHQEQRSLLARTGRVRTISVLQPAQRTAAALAELAPAAVYGLPSALLETAAALEGRGQWARPLRLFTSGELLNPSLRRTLESAYGCRVFDVYGTSETKEIAWECPLGSLHLTMRASQSRRARKGISWSRCW